jgi:hypothetical protein
VLSVPGYRRLWAARTVSQWGDIGQFTALCVRCPYRDGRWGRIELSPAIDLCCQTLRDDRGTHSHQRRYGMLLLKAVCEHDTAIVAFGIVKPIAESANRDLRKAVRASGATIADLPSSEQLVAWAFSWL